jgi:vacuolar-type H+-ATPase subunit I/STV1
MEDEAISLQFQALTTTEIEARERIALISDPNAKLTAKEVQDKNAEVRDLITIIEKDVEGVKRMMYEKDLDVAASADVKSKLSRHEKEITNLKESLRQANIKHKFSLAKQASQERKILLEGGEKTLQKRKIRSKEDALKTSEDVTNSLRRVRELMSSQVDHGNDIVNELDDQVKVIGNVITEHEQLGDDLQVAKGSIGKLFRREITDKMLMYFVVGFFIFVCLYILKVRLRISFGWLWGIFG